MNILPLTLFWLLLGSLMLDIGPLTAATKAYTDSVGLGAQDRHAKSMRMCGVKPDVVSFPDQLLEWPGNKACPSAAHTGRFGFW